MGREAEGQARFRGEAGAVRAILETDALILRGDLRARLPRAGLSGWRVEGDDLCLLAAGEPLVLTLGAKEAAAWVRALDKPLPTLAGKLGVSDAARAWVIGAVPPPEVAAAVAGATVQGPEGAALIIAVLRGADDLTAALEAGVAQGLRVWCVHGKGKDAAVGDAVVRAAFRGAGWMDIKSCAVSEAFSATLYRPPLEAGARR